MAPGGRLLGFLQHRHSLVMFGPSESRVQVYIRLGYDPRQHTESRFMQALLSSTYLKLDRIIKNKLNKRFFFLWRFEPVTLNKDMDDMERLSWTDGQNDRMTTEWQVIDFRDRFLKERRAYFERVQGPRPRNRSVKLLSSSVNTVNLWEKLWKAEDLRSDTRGCTRLSFSDTSGRVACGILWDPVGGGVASQHRWVFLPRSTGLSCISTLTLRMRCGQCMVNVWSM